MARKNAIPASLLAMEPNLLTQTIRVVVGQNPAMPAGMEFSVGAPFSFPVTPDQPFEMEVPQAHLFVAKVLGARYVDPRDYPGDEIVKELLKSIDSSALAKKRRNG